MSVVVKDPLIVVLPVTDKVPLEVIVAAANVPVNVGPAENTRLPVPVAPVAVTPAIIGVPPIVGEVNILLVKVCAPVRVATVASMSNVIASPVTADVNPVPPSIWKVSPELTAVPVESSPTKVMACDTFCAST